MTEGLFILTTIFVAYVVYQVVNDKKTSAQSAAKEAEPVIKAAQAEPAKAKSEPKQTATKKAEPKAAKPAAVEAAQAPAPAPAEIPSPAPAEPAAKSGLRDPKTGEVVSGYTNYRFTKRWIKDALVTEGLLDKVYKNNEIDAAAEVKIKAALTQLEAMDKYRA